jgi:hypothetical protein
MAYKGYDFFTRSAEKEETIRCKICNAVCDVERNVYDYSGFIAAMSNRKMLHDRFTCPHSGEAWHERALKLFMEIETTVSVRALNILFEDLHQTLVNNGIEISEEWRPRPIDRTH